TAGVSVHVLDHTMLKWNGRFLESNYGEIRYLYRLFVASDILNAPREYEPILRAVRAGTIRHILGPLYNLINNKGVLAYLWKQMENGTLDSSDRALVEDLVIYTGWVCDSSARELIANKDRYVIKPTLGSCGQGVICGNDLGGAEWQACVKKIVDGQ